MSILDESLILNETPDENTPCFDIKTGVWSYQNYNNKSKNLNIAVYCHQLTTLFFLHTISYNVHGGQRPPLFPTSWINLASQ